jgi:hypothetical protein
LDAAVAQWANFAGRNPLSSFHLTVDGRAREHAVYYGTIAVSGEIDYAF